MNLKKFEPTFLNIIALIGLVFTIFFMIGVAIPTLMSSDESMNVFIGVLAIIALLAFFCWVAVNLLKGDDS